MFGVKLIAFLVIPCVLAAPQAGTSMLGASINTQSTAATILAGVHTTRTTTTSIRTVTERSQTVTTTPTPTPSGKQIHPNGHQGKCLDVRGSLFANGTPVQIFDCNGTGAQRWLIKSGTTQVRVAGTDFCLDAGSNPGSGVPMKIWQCYKNLPAQTWYFTSDNRIAVQGEGQCLDLTNGKLTNGNRIQTWKCTDNNTNQIWTL